VNFETDEQQRDFAASIDAALRAADVPGAVRAWGDGDTAPGRKVWAQLADLGVTALMVPEKFDGIDAHPTDLVVALERIGYWNVPGPVTESVAVAPILLADDERSAALASGELIATVSLPPLVPRAVDADTAGLILLAEDGQVREGLAGDPHESVDLSRKLFTVNASGEPQSADVARAFEFGALATAAQLVGAGQAMLDAAVEYAKQRSQFGTVIGTYQAIKHKLADAYVNNQIARSNAYYGIWALDAGSDELPQAAAAARVAASAALWYASRESIQTHGGIGFTWEADQHLYYRRALFLDMAIGSPRLWRDRLFTAVEAQGAAAA